MIHPRKAVQALQAYTAPKEGRADKVRLDFNENTTGFHLDLGNLSGTTLAIYPEYEDFTAALATHWGVSPDTILLTNGSDEGLFLIPATFIEPNEDKAVISNPTFQMIPHYLKLAQAETLEVPVTEDLAFDIAGITAALKQQPKLAIFASPDNPTGALLDLETLSQWCQAFPDTLFVLDEAYADYTGISALPLLEQFENLLITRTFSKAWGLAGLRLGVVLGPAKLIHALRCVRSPYSVNALSVMAAKLMLPKATEVHQEALAVMQRKHAVIQALAERGYNVKAGAGNFFLLCAGIEAEALTRFCESQGVLIRNRSTLPHMWGLIRISIGTQSEMERFLKCIDDFKNHSALIFDLDDTLVDTSQSYDATIAALVHHYSGSPLGETELRELRAQGGFNDDWDATHGILKQRELHHIDRNEIESQGKRLYLECAKSVETMWVETELLAMLGQRHRLFIVTGRPRDEYTPVWEDRLSPWFEHVYCQDDFPDARRKPAPDILLQAMKDAGITTGIYIGNSVDDMTAAREAGLIPIGVTTTHEAAILKNAGAVEVLDSLNDLRKAFMR